MALVLKKEKKIQYRTKYISFKTKNNERGTEKPAASMVLRTTNRVGDEKSITTRTSDQVIYSDQINDYAVHFCFF